MKRAAIALLAVAVGGAVWGTPWVTDPFADQMVGDEVGITRAEAQPFFLGEVWTNNSEAPVLLLDLAMVSIDGDVEPTLSMTFAIDPADSGGAFLVGGWPGDLDGHAGARHRLAGYVVRPHATVNVIGVIDIDGVTRAEWAGSSLRYLQGDRVGEARSHLAAVACFGQAGDCQQRP